MKKLSEIPPPSLAKLLVWICAGIMFFVAVGAAQAPDGAAERNAATRSLQLATLVAP